MSVGRIIPEEFSHKEPKKNKKTKNGFGGAYFVFFGFFVAKLVCGTITPGMSEAETASTTFCIPQHIA